MDSGKENLLLAEELFRETNDELFASQVMGVFGKKALRIYHIEQAIEKLQRGIYIMYGVPYVKAVRKHPPLPFHQYIDGLITKIEQDEKLILDRDKIDKKDILTYSKSYLKVIEEINKKIKTERSVEYLDVAEVKKVVVSFTIAKTIVDTLLSNLLDVKILDGDGKLIQKISDKEELKLIEVSKQKLEMAFRGLDNVQFMISNMVVKNIFDTRKIELRFTTKELENPEKIMSSKKGNGVFTMDDMTLLITAHTTYSLAEVAFLHYITYPHMNPSRFPINISEKHISPVDYERNKFDITSLSKELISRTYRNLRKYERTIKFLKQSYQ